MRDKGILGCKVANVIDVSHDAYPAFDVEKPEAHGRWGHKDASEAFEQLCWQWLQYWYGAVDGSGQPEDK